MIGGERGMMGWNYGMMSGGIGLFGNLIILVVLIDAILLGIWLWKQIQK